MNTNDQNQARKQPADPQQGQQQKRIEPDHIEADHEQHPHKPRQLSQEDMQKIMPPSTDPDDPQSP